MCPSKSSFHSYIPSGMIFAKEHIARYAFASSFCKRMRVLDVACHLPFKEKSFDLVLALDLLEHIPKEKGIGLLNDVEKVARKRVVLSLPIGWHPSHHQGSPYDEHVSAWVVKELRERGYQIYTFYIRGTGGELFENRIPVYLRPFWLIIKTLAGLITSNYSNLAGYLVACKDVKNGR
jgi:hypothetical protein